jgi:hypothetical protein
MAHYNFNKDLIDGQNAEREAIELIIRKYNLNIDDISSCETNEYDFKINSRNETYEVKNDLMAQKTGNIAIEYESRGKSSGINVTKANYWIYKFAGLFFLFETQKIKEELFTNKNYYRNVTGGDFDSNTKMYLIKIPTFKNWGIQL